MNDKIIHRLTLRGLGILGAALFATMFYFTFSVPGWVEDIGASYIEREVEKRVDSTIDETIDTVRPISKENALGRFAESVFEKNEERIAELKTSLKNRAHEQLADAIAEIRNLDCECREKVASWLESGIESNIRLLQVANDSLTDFVQYKYMGVVAELKRDVRIFAASNAAAFLALLLVSFLKPGAVRHLFVPGLLLAASTLVCSWFYVFEQDWLMTIIHSDYLGFAYLAWLGVAFLFLCDIALNRGRVTTHIVNSILEAFGSAATLLPC